MQKKEGGISDYLPEFMGRPGVIAHLVIGAFSLGITWAVLSDSIASQGKQIAEHDAAIKELRRDFVGLNDMKTDIAVTKTQVSDIKESMSEIKQALNISRGGK